MLTMDTTDSEPCAAYMGLDTGMYNCVGCRHCWGRYRYMILYMLLVTLPNLPLPVCEWSYHGDDSAILETVSTSSLLNVNVEVMQYLIRHTNLTY